MYIEINENFYHNYMPKIKNIEKYLYLKKLDLKSLIINNDECIIYSLLNPINNEVKYIGKTDCIDRRYKHHLRSKSKSKVRSWIINICNKSMFPKLEIIDIVKINEWAFWEQHYISLYKSWGFNLLNSTIGGKNISISVSKRRRKPVLQFDLDNNFIKRWESPICIEKELGLKKSCIIDACKKIRQITAYGYVWEYEK